MIRKPKHIGSDPSLAAWCAALASPLVPDKVPPGWHTSRELCKRLGKSESRMGELLRGACERGACERQAFRVPSGGVMRPVPHYKLK
jgi:hypothetical protein